MHGCDAALAALHGNHVPPPVTELLTGLLDLHGRSALHSVRCAWFSNTHGACSIAGKEAHLRAAALRGGLRLREVHIVGLQRSNTANAALRVRVQRDALKLWHDNIKVRHLAAKSLLSQP